MDTKCEIYVVIVIWFYYLKKFTIAHPSPRTELIKFGEYVNTSVTFGSENYKDLKFELKKFNTKPFTKSNVYHLKF